MPHTLAHGEGANYPTEVWGILPGHSPGRLSRPQWAWAVHGRTWARARRGRQFTELVLRPPRVSSTGPRPSWPLGPAETADPHRGKAMRKPHGHALFFIAKIARGAIHGRRDKALSCTHKHTHPAPKSIRRRKIITAQHPPPPFSSPSPPPPYARMRARAMHVHTPLSPPLPPPTTLAHPVPTSGPPTSDLSLPLTPTLTTLRATGARRLAPPKTQHLAEGAERRAPRLAPLPLRRGGRRAEWPQQSRRRCFCVGRRGRLSRWPPTSCSTTHLHGRWRHHSRMGGGGGGGVPQLGATAHNMHAPRDDRGELKAGLESVKRIVGRNSKHPLSAEKSCWSGSC
jgi:hypothetical protein